MPWRAAKRNKAMKFKVGDRVNHEHLGRGTVIHVTDRNEKTEREAVENMLEKLNDITVEFDKENAGVLHDGGKLGFKGGRANHCYWFNHDTTKLTIVGRGKASSIHFILQYDLTSGDPIEEFETMKEVNERIKELVARHDVVKDSMVVYEVKSKKQVKVDTGISLKAA